MTQIVTVERYFHYKPLSDITAEQLERILDIAQHTVDRHTCGRLKDFESFPENIQERVVKAICAQTDFILTSFGADLECDIPESATIGNFSYTMSEKSKDITPTTLNYVAKLYLQSTGLLYRGDIGVC